jgi:hypothetical protein
MPAAKTFCQTPPGSGPKLIWPYNVSAAEVPLLRWSQRPMAAPRHWGRSRFLVLAPIAMCPPPGCLSWRGGLKWNPGPSWAPKAAFWPAPFASAFSTLIPRRPWDLFSAADLPRLLTHPTCGCEELTEAKEAQRGHPEAPRHWSTVIYICETIPHRRCSHDRVP